MNIRLKWSLVAWTALVVLGAGAPKNVRAYEYVPSGPSVDSDFDVPWESHTSTHDEEANAESGAEEGGYCTASVRTYTKGWDGDSAGAGMTGWGSWSQSWEWNGPPGTAPGGTLGWSADGGGSVYAQGCTRPGENGSASSSAGAGAGEGGGGGGASGSVSDSNVGSANANAGVSWGHYFGVVEDKEEGAFLAYAWWACNAGLSTPIPSGTSSVCFGGSVNCCCNSSANGGPDESGAWADSGSSADADVSLSASF